MPRPATGFDPIVVVTGYERHEVGKVVSERFDGFKGINVVHNRQWKQGIASSLHAALDFVDPFTRVGAVCVGLADQPRVGAEAYRRLAAAYADGAELAVATYGGVSVRTRCCWRVASGPKRASSTATSARGRDANARGGRRCPATAPGARSTSTPPHDLERLNQESLMKIEDEFRVDVPVEEAWKVLLDVERIAPCMPGAQLQEVEGDEYRGHRQGEGRPDHRAVQGRRQDHRGRRGRARGRAQGRGPRHAWPGQRVGDGHRHARARRRPAPSCTSTPTSTSPARSRSSAGA